MIPKPTLPTKDKTMWHIVVHINDQNMPCGVEMTTNPYEHSHKAAIIMHKSGSRQVSAQVARFVRRTLHIAQTTINRSNRPREAKIGYAVTTDLQYPPNDRTPCFDLVKRMSSMPVDKMLEEVKGGHNASRTRYVVYEVRSQGDSVGRFVSNKTSTIDRMWNEAPPDTIDRPSVHVVGRHETMDQAMAQAQEVRLLVNAKLWTRQPPIEWLRSTVQVVGEDVVYRSTGKTVIRQYEQGPRVILGSHAYTVRQVLHALQQGAWFDGRLSKHSNLWPGE